MSTWKKFELVRRGLSHIADGIGCQDNVAVAENDSILVAALSDGLGSLRLSELASRTATQTVCEHFIGLQPGLFDDPELSLSQIGERAIRHVQGAILSMADERGYASSEMDCNLAFVCISKTHGRALIGLLGDCAVCVFGKEQSVALSGSGKSANGTYAVLDRDASEHLIVKQTELDADGVLGFLLTSDGLENELYMKGSSRVSKTAASYFNTLTEPDGAAKPIGERIDRLTSVPDSPFDDDISLVILSRTDEKLELPPDPTWLCSCGERNPLQSTYCLHCGADFLTLYQHVRFKEHGGRVAFFEKMNADPDAERSVLGLSAAKERPVPKEKPPAPRRPLEKAEAEPREPIEKAETEPHTLLPTGSGEAPRRQEHPVPPKQPAKEPKQTPAAPGPREHRDGQPAKQPLKKEPPVTPAEKPGTKLRAERMTVIAILCFLAGILVGALFMRLFDSGEIRDLNAKLDAAVTVRESTVPSGTQTQSDGSSESPTPAAPPFGTERPGDPDPDGSDKNKIPAPPPGDLHS